jgi:enoyl-CoA hydratase/carnithine racemase
VAVATLNRPEVRNAVDERIRSELEAILDHVANDQKIHALVLTGKDPAFCAGGDISAMRQHFESRKKRGRLGGQLRLD